MITLVVSVEEVGGVMSTSYHAEEDPLTSSPREAKTVDEIANAIQRHLADKGGTGKFVAKRPRK